MSEPRSKTSLKKTKRSSSRTPTDQVHASANKSGDPNPSTTYRATISAHACDHFAITPKLSPEIMNQIKEGPTPAWTFSSNHKLEHEICFACQAGANLGERAYHIVLKSVDDEALQKLIEDSLTFALVSRGLESRRYFNLGDKMICKLSKRGGDSLIRRGLEKPPKEV